MREKNARHDSSVRRRHRASFRASARRTAPARRDERRRSEDTEQGPSIEQGPKGKHLPQKRKRGALSTLRRERPAAMSAGTPRYIALMLPKMPWASSSGPAVK